MRILTRYILWEWVKSFLLFLFITIGVLILNDMYNQLPDFLEAGATTGQILRFYLALIPSFLPIIIPLTMLISALFTLSNFHKNNEIIAMQTCGMNVFQITRSLWIAATVICAVSFYLNSSLIPWSITESRTFKNNLLFEHEATQTDAANVGILNNFTYDNQKEHRIWYLNRFSEYTFQGYGVYVFQLNKQGREVARLQAKEAYFDDVNNHWIFLKGREITLDPQNGEPIRSLPFETLDKTDWSERPQLMRSMNEDPRDLSLLELRAVLERAPVKTNPRSAAYAVRYNKIWATALTPLIVIALAIPFATSGVRVNPAVNLSKCAGLFFVYYFVENVSTVLGSQLIVPAILAAWLPNIVILFVSIYLFRKAI
jgi:lipopolysaccharide export system permease protein